MTSEGVQPVRRTFFDDRFRDLFVDLYESHDGGRFKSLIIEQSSTSNMVKAKAWDKFAAEFSSSYGAPISKSQLQNFHKRIVKETRKKLNDSRDIQKARTVANITGGGPPAPEPQQVDGDVMDFKNPLGLPAVVPIRTNADGTIIRLVFSIQLTFVHYGLYRSKFYMQ